MIASVVGTLPSLTIPAVSMPNLSNVAISILPKASAPTLPINAQWPPSFAAIAKTLHGAPPGFTSKTILLFWAMLAGVMSISNSPIETMSNFLIMTLLL